MRGSMAARVEAGKLRWQEGVQRHLRGRFVIAGMALADRVALSSKAGLHGTAQVQRVVI